MSARPDEKPSTQATHAPAAARGHRVVLKRGDTFLLCDTYADIRSHVDPAHGMYTRDTRVLSRLELRLVGADRAAPQSRVMGDGAGEEARYVCGVGGHPVQVLRRRFLHAETLFERIVLRNADAVPVKVRVQLGYAADFADIFEVRGTPRTRRGELRVHREAADRVAFHYRALDGETLTTRVAVEPVPRYLDAECAELELTLDPNMRRTVFVHVGSSPPSQSPRMAFCRNLRAAARHRRKVLARRVAVSSDNPAFDAAFRQAWSDLRMLTVHTPHGLYPYAGTPWFSTAFGRDGIITALLTLWMAPELARGVLEFLAFYQASEVEPERDAEPGKILHEMRQGEMARLGEVPFGRYYGSIDATPLYLVLMGAYYERTGDLETVRGLWPNAERALAWIDRYGDVDGDGFVEYAHHAENGIENQGWKDSRDAIFHRDGRLVEGPVALCEVQGYVYAARLAAAKLAAALGLEARATALRAAAEALRAHFEAAFWREELGAYALALDGHKRPCDVVSSNAGQVLFSGIASPAHAERIVRTLWSPDCYSGWGLRTVTRSAVRYAPDSYHNGSVWPHDNAMIARGFARYRLGRHLPALLSGFCAAAASSDDDRLPELFCGDPREPGRPPRPYPVACHPQAWAAATLPSLLQSCLGLEWCAARRVLRFTHAALPTDVNLLTIRGLRLGDASVDVRVTRGTGGVHVEALAARGDIALEVVP